MAAYPAELPIFELRNVLSIINSGNIMAQKAEFFRDLWWIQGYGQKLALGEGTQLTPASVAAATEFTSDQDAAVAIQKIIDSADQASAQSLAPLWTALITWAINKALEYLLP